MARTQKVITAAPAISRMALMICTQVVPFMPPIRTYMIIRAPTTMITRACPPQSLMPSSREIRLPAPAICARR